MVGWPSPMWLINKDQPASLLKHPYDGSWAPSTRGRDIHWHIGTTNPAIFGHTDGFLVGGFNQPIWKICKKKVGSFPQLGIQIKAYLKPPPSYMLHNFPKEGNSNYQLWAFFCSRNSLAKHTEISQGGITRAVYVPKFTPRFDGLLVLSFNGPFIGNQSSSFNPPALPACLVKWGLMTDCLSVLCFCLYSLS